MFSQLFLSATWLQEPRNARFPAVSEIFQKKKKKKKDCLFWLYSFFYTQWIIDVIPHGSLMMSSETEMPFLN